MQTQNSSTFYTITDSDGDTFNIHSIEKAVKLDGGTAVNIGDSGGHVFKLNGTGVTAMGIVVGRGGTTMFFQDWTTIGWDFGVWPNTV